MTPQHSPKDRARLSADMNQGMQWPWAAQAEAGGGPCSTRSRRWGPGQACGRASLSFRSAWHCWISQIQEPARGPGLQRPALACKGGTGAAHRHSARGTREHRASSKLGLCPSAAMLGSWRTQRARTRQVMTGRRVPGTQSSTSLPPEVRGCLGRGARDTAPGCTALPAHAAEAGPDPGVPREEVGGSKQDSRQAERLWHRGQGKHGDSANLGELPSLVAWGRLCCSFVAQYGRPCALHTAVPQGPLKGPWDLPGGPGALCPPELCNCKLGIGEGALQ